MPGTEPFPKLLVWSLVGPYPAYFVLLVLQLEIRAGPVISDALGWLLLGAAGVQIAAVCAAIAMLIWREGYRTRGNFVLVGVATVPWAVLVLVFGVSIFVLGHRIHF